ncbi:hypothetical protein OS493_005098 [Desmophyllum pertusum]|uniref:Uncharacterized protein n=1 Tax=Desmophyllum pertusum TaxID=174260 RepID=A0A9W9Z4C2_9CNID|nr:hypothetical protein OS493_005098 [Desmophyllum pertusum]
MRKQESSPTLSSSVKHPSISSADTVVNPSDGPPKENREERSKGVGLNMENSNRHEQMPGDIENVHPSNRNIPHATKPPTGIEAPNIESKVIGTNREKGLKGFVSVKSIEQANKTPAVAKPPSGRGRGIVAANFSGRPTVQVESKTSGSTQLHTKGEANNPEVRRGRGITYATTVTNAPPGLTVTDEGKRLARNLGQRVKGDQINDLVVSMEGKIGAERNKYSSEALMEENQESNYNDLNIDEGNPKDESSKGRPKDQTTSSPFTNTEYR